MSKFLLSLWGLKKQNKTRTKKKRQVEWHDNNVPRRAE